MFKPGLSLADSCQSNSGYAREFMLTNIDFKMDFLNNLVPALTSVSEVDYYYYIKWKHFPRYWPFVRKIHRGPVNSPHKGQWRGAFMFSLICVWINDWINNREAGHLRRYRAYCDVTMMSINIQVHFEEMYVKMSYMRCPYLFCVLFICSVCIHLEWWIITMTTHTACLSGVWHLGWCFGYC